MSARSADGLNYWLSLGNVFAKVFNQSSYLVQVFLTGLYLVVFGATALVEKVFGPTAGFLVLLSIPVMMAKCTVSAHNKVVTKTV